MVEQSYGDALKGEYAEKRRKDTENRNRDKDAAMQMIVDWVDSCKKQLEDAAKTGTLSDLRIPDSNASWLYPFLTSPGEDEFKKQFHAVQQSFLYELKEKHGIVLSKRMERHNEFYFIVELAR